MELKKAIKAYKVSQMCTKCGVGVMEATGVVAMSFPPQYQHKCPNCNYTVFYKEQYPKYTYEEPTSDDIPSPIAESKPIPKLNKWEHLFCRMAGEGYIARDANGIMYWFNVKPTKGHGWELWESTDIYLSLNEEPFSKLKFPFIQWLDDEPWAIEELLKLEVEDD